MEIYQTRTMWTTLSLRLSVQALSLQLQRKCYAFFVLCTIPFEVSNNLLWPLQVMADKNFPYMGLSTWEEKAF